MQKRGSQPVCSASHTPRFSYDQEPQTLSCPLKRQKGAEERWSVQSMTTASEEQKHWRMQLAWHIPLGQPAGPGWAPLAGSLPPAAGTRVTQWQHSPIAGHAVSGAGRQLLLNCLTATTRYVWYGLELSSQSHVWHRQTLKPQEREELLQQSQHKEDAYTFQGFLSQLVPVTRCPRKGGGADPAKYAGWSYSSHKLSGHQNVQRLLQNTELQLVCSVLIASLVHSLTNLFSSSNICPHGLCQPLILTNEAFVWPNWRTDAN